MSEPLDLEQFAGHTPGPWGLEEPDYADDDMALWRILYGTRLHGMPSDVTEAGDPLGYVGRCLSVHEEIEIGRDMAPCEDECGTCYACRSAFEIAANARLLAAAPSLLAEVLRLRAAVGRVEALAERWGTWLPAGAWETPDTARVCAQAIHEALADPAGGGA